MKTRDMMPDQMVRDVYQALPDLWMQNISGEVPWDKQREITQADVEQAITELGQRRQAQQQPPKPGRRSAKGSAINASTLPVQDPSFDTV